MVFYSFTNNYNEMLTQKSIHIGRKDIEKNLHMEDIQNRFYQYSVESRLKTPLIYSSLVKA